MILTCRFNLHVSNVAALMLIFQRLVNISETFLRMRVVVLISITDTTLRIYALFIRHDIKSRYIFKFSIDEVVLLVSQQKFCQFLLSAQVGRNF